MSEAGTFALNPETIRRKFPPKGGWVYRQPETGWRTTSPMVDTYSVTVEKIIRHREANPQYGMAADRKSVERDLQQFTAVRLLSDAPEAAREWIVALDETGVQKKKTQPSVPASFIRAAGAGLAAVGRRVTRDLVGLRVLVSWLGEGGNPVAQRTAIARAGICSKCSKNIDGYKPEALVARTIRLHESRRHQLQLQTPFDDKLKSCSVCLCHLPLKVWVPLDKIRRDTAWREMPDWCWIRNEGAARTPLSVRRRGAFGDVIATSVVAERIQELGFDVTVVCDELPGQALVGHPTLKVVNSGPFDIDLDGAYELSREIADRHIYSLLYDKADTQLRKFGVRIGLPANCLPTPVVTASERDAMSTRMQGQGFKLAVIPRSNAWVNRTVPEETWREVASTLAGRATLFWTGTHRAYTPLHDLKVQNFREVMGAIAASDVVLTVDTGPMHAAAALRKPILAVQEAFRIDLRLTDHSDWQSVQAPLDCIGCCKYRCPINKDNPPCAEISPSVIEDGVVKRLGALDMNRVGAVIAVYRPDVIRLKRVVEAIQHQVQEIIIVMDGNEFLNFSHPMVRIIKNPTGVRTGYAKTAMRGVRHTNSGWILLLNDDCYLAPDAVAKMRSSATDKTAVVGCLLKYPNGKIQHGGTYPSNTGIGWGHIDHGKLTPSITSVTEMEGVTLAASLVRRSAFFSVGGFDDRFDCYGEDEDLCKTLRKNGWIIQYNPFAQGIHDEGLSTGPNKTQMLHKAYELLKSKWEK